jgi:hypothetical protein
VGTFSGTVVDNFVTRGSHTVNGSFSVTLTSD